MSLEGKADTQREGGPDVMMAIVGHLPSLKATSHPGGLRGSDVDKLHYMHRNDRFVIICILCMAYRLKLCL